MQYKDDEFYWYWFVNVKGVGSITRRRLLDYFEHPREIYHAGEKECGRFLTEKQLSYLLTSRNTNVIDKSRKQLKDNRIRFIHWQSKDYPEKLRQLFDPPYGLYLRGRLPDAEMPALGIVGARNATAYGRNMAARFAENLAKRGIQIISGLAAGVDAAGHRGALCGGGYTLGILGGGIDTVYPKENFNLYMELYRKGGVLSEYNMGVQNHPGLFPVRNRLISGLSDAILVVEAGYKSGSLITTDQALEQGKDVFALPGRVTDRQSLGCNRLISQGALLVREPGEIFEELQRKKKMEAGILEHNVLDESKLYSCHLEENDTSVSKGIPVFYNEEQKKIYGYLDEITPTSFDMLLHKTGYNIARLQHILFEMELEEWIFQPNQNLYLKKIL